VAKTSYALVIPAVENNRLCRELLHNLLTSVSAGEYTCPVVICWDNVPENSIRYFENEFPFVHSLAHSGPENLNFAKNSNRGLRFAYEQLACGVFLVNMDVCLPNKIYLERIINTGVSSPYQKHVEGIASAKVAKLNALAKERCLHEHTLMEEKQRLVGFCLWISRHAFDKIGYLDDVTFAASFEDDDYCVRACLARLPCARYGIPVHHEIKDRLQQLSTTNAYDVEQLVDHFHRFRRKWDIPFNVAHEDFASYILAHRTWESRWKVS
jgi:GT2 family glycosyltransferase